MPTMKQKPTWSEKLDRDEGFPKVVPIGPSMTSHWGEGTMVIPAPREVERDHEADSRRQADHHQRDPSGPGTSAWGDDRLPDDDRDLRPDRGERGGRSRGRRTDEEGTPYWRTLKTGGFLNEKYPGGVASQKAKLEDEGHRINQQGKRYAVAGYEKALAVAEVED